MKLRCCLILAGLSVIAASDLPAQNGLHTITNGPGTGVVLDANGGVVNQSNAVGAIQGVPSLPGQFAYMGTLFNLPNPGGATGWGTVIPGVVNTSPNLILPPAGWTLGFPAFQPGGNLGGPGLAPPAVATEPMGSAFNPNSSEILALNNAVFSTVGDIADENSRGVFTDPKNPKEPQYSPPPESIMDFIEDNPLPPSGTKPSVPAVEPRFLINGVSMTATEISLKMVAETQKAVDDAEKERKRINAMHAEMARGSRQANAIMQEIEERYPNNPEKQKEELQKTINRTLDLGPGMRDNAVLYGLLNIKLEIEIQEERSARKESGAR